jgi:hypothetical protein
MIVGGQALYLDVLSFVFSMSNYQKDGLMLLYICMNRAFELACQGRHHSSPSCLNFMVSRAFLKSWCCLRAILWVFESPFRADSVDVLIFSSLKSFDENLKMALIESLRSSQTPQICSVCLRGSKNSQTALAYVGLRWTYLDKAALWFHIWSFFNIAHLGRVE